jgi:hypothetical protein
MSSNLDLLFRLKADTVQAKAALGEFRGAAGANIEQIVQKTTTANERIALSNKAVIDSYRLGTRETTLLTEKELKRRADVADAEYVRQEKAAAKAAAAEVKTAETTAAKIAAIRKEMTRIVESENLKQEAVLGRLGISGVAGGGVGAGALASNAVNLGRSAEQAEGKLAALEAEAVALDSTFVSTAGQVGVVGTSLTALAGPAGIAIAGLAAVGLGFVGLSALIYKATKSAADYGDEIYKAAQKTGLSTEFLSVARVRVEETDGSFQNLTTGLARFQIALSKALSNPTAEASKALQVLHLTVDQLRDALPDERVKLFGKALMLPNETESRLILGSRGFLDQIKIVEDLGTKYDELHDKAEALGLIFTGTSKPKQRMILMFRSKILTCN